MTHGVNGKLVNPNEVDAMAEEIIFYLLDAEIALQIAMSARKDVEESYNKEININKWCAIIDKIR